MIHEVMTESATENKLPDQPWAGGGEGEKVR